MARATTTTTATARAPKTAPKSAPTAPTAYDTYLAQRGKSLPLDPASHKPFKPSATPQPQTQPQQSAADDMTSDMESDASSDVASPDTLARIVASAQEMRDHQRRQAEYEQKAEDEKKAAFQLATEVLPALMSEASIKELTLEDGSPLTLGDEVFASISEENMSKAIAWLDKNNYGDIVKSFISIPMDRTNPAWCTKVRNYLAKAKIPFSEKGAIHAGTLKAFVKESLTSTPVRKLPKEISTHLQPTAKIKAPKKAKK